MNHSQISLTNGLGISIFLTVLLGLGTILNIYLATQSLAKPTTAVFMFVGSMLFLGFSYTSYPRWVTIKVLNSNTIEWTTKTLYGTKTERYENITKIKLYHPKGGYAFRIYQKRKEDNAFKGGLGKQDAQVIVDLLRRKQLPLQTEYFQEK